MSKKLVVKYLCGSGLLLLLIAGGLSVALLRAPKQMPKMLLPDGRLLQIEAVTYGTRHQIGSGKIVERFGPWLPSKLRDFLSPKYPHSEFDLKSPALVVWVNAIDPTTGQHVDCQSIRVEMIDEHGELFGSPDSHWFGGTKFWRQGHVFEAFPREQRTLTMIITSLKKKTNGGVRVAFANPRVTRPARWQGSPLPQRQTIGDLEIGLTDLIVRTNGGLEKYWETPVRYWEPVWELRKEGRMAAGWDPPEWIAEDPTGNRSKFLGLHAPVLLFSATVYPSATNMQAPLLLASSPASIVPAGGSNIWWNIKAPFATKEILLLGLFPAGTHVFFEGNYETNPPVRMGPVRGGAPSGWTSQARQVTPIRLETRHCHYTPSPVVYLRAPSFDSKDRLAVRLRDDQGRYWLTKPEPQGTREGISPFLVEVSSDVKTIVAEVVLLKPAAAKFMVQTGKSGEP